MNAESQDVPDYLRKGLKLVIVGLNPGNRSGATGHHYAWPGNHFWPLMYQSGLIPEPISAAEDARVLEWDIGLTNLVDRTTRSGDDLGRGELAAGAVSLREKLLRFRPLVVAFNAKMIYEAFSGRRSVRMGLQDERLDGMVLFVMPSTSARTTSYQRPHKLEYFRELKALVNRVSAESGR